MDRFANLLLDVAEVLGEATEDEIRDYEDALKQLKARAAADLQQNVYQNRTQFIKISKEAEKLKGEMRTLRNLMSELKTNTTALRASSNSVDSSGGLGPEFALSKKDRRSSIVDRTALWSAQMQVSNIIKSAVALTIAKHVDRLYTKPLKDHKNSCPTLKVATWFRMQARGLNWITQPTSPDDPCKYFFSTTTC